MFGTRYSRCDRTFSSAVSSVFLAAVHDLALGLVWFDGVSSVSRGSRCACLFCQMHRVDAMKHDESGDQKKWDSEMSRMQPVLSTALTFSLQYTIRRDECKEFHPSTDFKTNIFFGRKRR